MVRNHNSNSVAILDFLRNLGLNILGTGMHVAHSPGFAQRRPHAK